MMTETDDGTNGTEVFRAFIGARQHHDELEPSQFPTASFSEHPCQKTLQDQSTLAMSHHGDRAGIGGLSCQVGGQGLRDVVVVWDSCGRPWPAQLRRLVLEPMNPQSSQIGVAYQTPH